MSESLRSTNDHFDLCVVGAGYAGLNASFVATRYLPATTRVLVLDKHQQPGGMWNDAYSYVRLHQPYRMFTAGNVGWSLRRERSYLATRDEVAAHLRHCFDVISQRLDVDARWGWECLDYTESSNGVAVTARDPDGEISTFTADRLVDATSFDVAALEPLPLTSQRVRSIAPCQLADAGLFNGDNSAAAWIVGSGKTAMDTIVALARANPARPIGMITGTGTFFFNRDLINPTGLKRWLGGVRYNAIFAAAAKRFDGTNAAEVNAWCRSRYGTSALDDPEPTHVLFALLSGDETAAVRAGANEVVRDHLVDVVDDLAGPVMVLRSGVRHPIPSASWVVNCTGHLRPRETAYVPYVSPLGRAMALSVTSSIFPSPGAAAYILAQLFFLNRLADAPLYELDLVGLFRDAPDAVLPVASSLLAYNLGVAMERVPLKAFRTFGLDIDRWYPPMRQLAGQLQAMRANKRDRQRHRDALDTFSERTNVRCGLLSPAPSAA